MHATSTERQRRAVFLDRDGTLNVEVNYLHRIADMQIIPGAPEAIQALNQAGYLVILVTNQSGIARGYYDEATMHKLHAHLSEVLSGAAAHLDAIYFCPHHPDFTGICDCRKPAPGLLLRAAAEWNIDLRKSWVVGDTASDLEAGMSTGCRTILVRSGYGASVEVQVRAGRVLCPDAIVDDIRAAARYIRQCDRQ